MMSNDLSDELHDLCQVLLLLQDLLGFGAQGHKLWEVLVIVLIQSTSVLAVADQPVHRGEVLPLSQLLIETPEHLREERRGEMIILRTQYPRQPQQICLIRPRDLNMCFTCTIPRVAEVTGSEKSPPGGDTLQETQNILTSS